MVQVLKKRYLKWALSGGEDFELIFTITEANLRKLRNDYPDFTVYEVGKVVDEAKGCKLLLRGKEEELGSGYDHFA